MVLPYQYKWLFTAQEQAGKQKSLVRYRFKHYYPAMVQQLKTELLYVYCISRDVWALRLAAISSGCLMAEQTAERAAASLADPPRGSDAGRHKTSDDGDMKLPPPPPKTPCFGRPRMKIFVSERTPEGDLPVLRTLPAPRGRGEYGTICPTVRIKF